MFYFKIYNKRIGHVLFFSVHGFYNMVCRLSHRNFVLPSSSCTSVTGMYFWLIFFLYIFLSSLNEYLKIIFFKQANEYLRYSWNIGYDSYVIEPRPNDLQLQLGIRKQNTWLWIVHSNQLHSMLDHLPRRMDCCRIACHNRHKWNILDGSVCQLHSNNHPILEQ